MNIQPTKEHLEIIKEIGSKWVIGLATMHGALLITTLTNYGKDMNVFFSMAILCFGVGAMAALLIGHNIFMMLLKHYYKTELGTNYYKETKEFRSECIEVNEENILVESENEIEEIQKKDIKAYNINIELLKNTSLLCLLVGGVVLLAGINLSSANMIFNIFVFMLCIIGLFHLGSNIYQLKNDSRIYKLAFFIDFCFVIVALGLIYSNIIKNFSFF